MGAGIAQVSIDKGIYTVMKDMNMDGLARGINQVQSGLDAKLKRKRIAKIDAEKYMSNLEATVDYDKFRKVGAVSKS